MKPIVAIVGRPNVGKSTFYNRITRTKGAMVDNLPGVTRDRNYGDATWDGVDFTVVDTGGFYEVSDDEFADQIRFQLFQAIEEADAVIHMLDGKAGVSPFDTDLIEALRSVNKPVFYQISYNFPVAGTYHVSCKRKPYTELFFLFFLQHF